MEDVFMWLNQPLFQDSFIRIWMAAAVGTGFVLAMILILVLIRKRKKKEKAKLDEKDPITEKPDPLPILELANLQGIGNREEQQDALEFPAWSTLRRTDYWQYFVTEWAVWPRVA